MHKEGGASETWPYYASTSPININPHAFGTTRMGTDPDTSVVDPWVMSHEVPNLAILGGSGSSRMPGGSTTRRSPSRRSPGATAITSPRTGSTTPNDRNSRRGMAGHGRPRRAGSAPVKKRRLVDDYAP